jgi:hypothetical protein
VQNCAPFAWFKLRWVGSCVIRFEAFAALTYDTACTLAKLFEQPSTPEATAPSFSSTTAPIVTEWSDPVPGRDLHPQRTNAFNGAHNCSTRARLTNPATRSE